MADSAKSQSSNKSQSSMQEELKEEEFQLPPIAKDEEGEELELPVIVKTRVADFEGLPEDIEIQPYDEDQ